MKRFFLYMIIFLSCGIMSFRATAQVSVTAHATAEVIESLAAIETSQLNFGSFSPETEGGRIMVTPEGSRSAQGTVVMTRGMYNAASFYLTGENNASFSITLPSSPVALTNTSTSKTMYVTNWISSPSQGTGVAVLDGGSKTISVGATLLVGNINDNPKGIYSGTYSITFDYN